ncbi:uncharacterized protein TNCV_4297321 [Trichonephila clavipes]|nr:uncharacterized protein TNCV_4297321 [Trichonephila clavipes]
MCVHNYTIKHGCDILIAFNRVCINLKKRRLAICALRFVVYHTFEDAPVCDAASRIVEAIVSELRVHATTNVFELFLQALVVLQTSPSLNPGLLTRLHDPLRPCGSKPNVLAEAEGLRLCDGILYTRRRQPMIRRRPGEQTESEELAVEVVAFVEGWMVLLEMAVEAVDRLGICVFCVDVDVTFRGQPLFRNGATGEVSMSLKGVKADRFRWIGYFYYRKKKLGFRENKIKSNEMVNNIRTVPLPDCLKQLTLERNGDIPIDAIKNFTDGSRDDNYRSGSGIYIKSQDHILRIQRRNPDGCSVFRSELIAIDEVLGSLASLPNGKEIWILPDSRSAIQHFYYQIVSKSV